VRKTIIADGIIVDSIKILEKIYNKKAASIYPFVEFNSLWISAGQRRSESVAFKLPDWSSF
jgi:hypothetical protein